MIACDGCDIIPDVLQIIVIAEARQDWEPIRRLIERYRETREVGDATD